MSSSGVSAGSSSSGGAKRSFADLLKEVFVQASAGQLDMLQQVSAIDFEQDQTGWTTQAIQIHGLMELIDVANLTPLIPFLAPASVPADGILSFDYLTTTTWTVFVLKQDLSRACLGLMVRIGGSTDTTERLFPRSGGLVINPPMGKVLVARKSAGGTMTALQEEIAQVMYDSGLGRGMGARTAPIGTPPATTPGGSECVKKATLSSVLDINGEVRVVYSKEGGNARMKLWAALIRECEEPRLRVYLGLDYDSSTETIQDMMLAESERDMLQTDAMASLSRLDTISRLEVWMDPDAFRHFLLLDLPQSDWQYSLRNFKGPESSAWTRDCAGQGRENLLQAVENLGNFQRVTKGEAYRDCMGPIRVLWEDPGRFVKKYHNEYLQFQLERMFRVYAHEVTKTQGKQARMAGGLALGGQKESVALLQWCVNEFVALVRSGTLEASPHERFYASEQYMRIANKSVREVAKSRTIGGGGPGGGRGVAGSPGGKAPPFHKDGLCLWYLAGKLGLTNQKGDVFECRTPDGEDPAKHTVLSKVKLSTVKMLLKDPKFTAVCSADSLKTAILAKAIDEKRRFKAE